MNNFLLQKPIAHRGLHNGVDIIENTISAFEKAIKNNYPIELDVQLTLDKKVVAFHDVNTTRLTGKNFTINRTVLKDLKNLRIKNSDEQIPTFEEVIRLVDGTVPLLIEIKNEKLPGDLEKEVLRLLKEYNGEIAIQSFNPFTVKKIKKENPVILVGQVSSDFKDINFPSIQKYILKNMFLNFWTKPDFISYDIDALPNTRVENLRKNGMPILAWTVRTTAAV